VLHIKGTEEISKIAVFRVASIIKAIALVTEAASTSETSVNLYRTTWRNIPEDSRFHIHRRQKLKPH
jgi:hypothetical protein